MRHTSEPFLQWQKSWYVKLSLSLQSCLFHQQAVDTASHNSPSLPPSLPVERDWTLQFLFAFLLLLHFYFRVLRTSEETSCACNVVSQRPPYLLLCLLQPLAGFWPASWRWLPAWQQPLAVVWWFLVVSAWVKKKKKSQPQAVKVTFQPRVNPQKLWQVQTWYSSSEMRGESESIYIQIDASKYRNLTEANYIAHLIQ